jgi:hypothetical protein
MRYTITFVDPTAGRDFDPETTLSYMTGILHLETVRAATVEEAFARARTIASRRKGLEDCDVAIQGDDGLVHLLLASKITLQSER